MGGGDAGRVGRIWWGGLPARARGAPHDRTIGVLGAGHLHDIVPLLDHVEGITELVVHPGIGVDAYPHWHYDWEAETRALCAPGLRDAIAARGIELIAPSQAVRTS